MKKIIFVLLLASVIITNAQETKPTDKILESYLTELQLDINQKKQFINVYSKYKTQLNAKSIENNEFNRINKERDLGFYKILNQEQIKLYRKLKKELEPTFTFRM